MNSDVDLTAGAGECLEKARSSAHGRNAHLVLHDGPLRQTLIALTADSELAEHEAPPAASLHVLTGSVVLDGTTHHSGALIPIPHHRHSLRAVEDSVVLLTTVTGI
ncbi:hypothetical protein [Herbidospora mongoliensis]|uniref:hypothetical protein n=1 Tax=Herbidospora mongoliensis TaxID=688067 RepID=UPI00082C03F2|nr:hypothetical protein [Herbidospora mongoliensis]